jgi:hypothetical protein
MFAAQHTQLTGQHIQLTGMNAGQETAPGFGEEYRNDNG